MRYKMRAKSTGKWELTLSFFRFRFYATWYLPSATSSWTISSLSSCRQKKLKMEG